MTIKELECSRGQISEAMQPDREVPLAESMWHALVVRGMADEDLELSLADGRRVTLDFNYTDWQDAFFSSCFLRTGGKESRVDRRAEFGAQLSGTGLDINSIFFVFLHFSDQEGPVMGFYSDEPTVSLLRELEEELQYDFGEVGVIPDEVVKAFDRAIAEIEF